MPRLTAIDYAFNKEGSRSILLTIGELLDLELFLRNNDHSIKLGLQEMGLFCATISIPVPGRFERIAPIWPPRTKQLEASPFGPPQENMDKINKLFRALNRNTSDQVRATPASFPDHLADPPPAHLLPSSPRTAPKPAHSPSLRS